MTPNVRVLRELSTSGAFKNEHNILCPAAGQVGIESGSQFPTLTSNVLVHATVEIVLTLKGADPNRNSPLGWVCDLHAQESKDQNRRWTQI